MNKRLKALEIISKDMKKIKGGAKETFDRSKPHVNIGTVGTTTTTTDTGK